MLLCDDKLPVKEGDGVRRTLPNGNVEDYAIEYVYFQRSHEDIPSIVELTVHKTGIPRRAQGPAVNFRIARTCPTDWQFHVDIRFFGGDNFAAFAARVVFSAIHFPVNNGSPREGVSS